MSDSTTPTTGQGARSDAPSPALFWLYLAFIVGGLAFCLVMGWLAR